MKYLPVFSLPLLLVGCQQQEPVATTDVQLTTVKHLTTVEFEVPNMVCEFSCVPMVEKTLASQPGVEHVTVDLETRTAKVEVHAEQFDADAAIAALVDVQFIDTKIKQPATASASEDSADAAVAHATNG